MAQTILQQPTTPNGTLANLIYVVSSTNSTEPQFRYIADVYYSGSVDRLTRLKFFPNQDNSGVVDLGKVLNDYLNPELDEVWKNGHTTESYNPNGNKDFEVKFGEEYGTSLSSSITVYESQSVSDPISVFEALVDPNGGSYNFPSSSYSNLLGDIRLSNYPYVSSNPTYYTKDISVNDYETLTVLNGTNGVNINSITKYGSGGTVVLHSGEITEPTVTIPVGPANFTTGAPTDDYYIRFGFTTGNDVDYYYTIAEECNYDRVRFAFINKFGFWDYYGINLPQNKITRINRKQYQSTYVDYSGVNPQYDVNKRGKTDYYISYNDIFAVSTPFLQQGEANWLTELIESKEVFLQETVNGVEQFVPVNINNTDYTWKTNPRGQKVFQYNISWVYSNPRFSRS